jgi:small subunit ribosomal protein S1
MDGLIHISELSWSHVNHPSEVLEIGQDVKVKVLDIDRERQRISLGLKQTQSDPWQQVLETYQEGDEVEGRVTKVVTFGAFVEIMPGVEGLVHISELAQHHVENPREVVSQGDLVKAKIIEVDADRRRLSLSLKRVEGGGVQQRADDSEALEGTPNLDLSEEVFPDAAQASVADGVPDEEVSPEDVAESVEPPLDEAPVAEAPVAEPPTEEPPAAEPPAVEEPLAEVADASIEADQVAPEQQGPGDSEGEPPAAPEPAEPSE